MYCILYLKGATRLVHDPQAMYARLRSKMLSFGDVSWALIAPAGDLLDAENQCRSRRRMTLLAAPSNDWFFFCCFTQC